MIGIRPRAEALLRNAYEQTCMLVSALGTMPEVYVLYYRARGVASALEIMAELFKRIGDKFPGNAPPAYDGTTTQEAIRALIDRTKYVDAQIHFDANDEVLLHLRFALVWLEHRAAIARDDRDAAAEIWKHHTNVEMLPTCEKCGHVMCSREEH